MVRFGALSSLMLLPVGLAWKIALDDEVRHRLEQPELQLISFIAPETDNSKAIETEWEAVVKEVSALTVNCTASRSLCQELDVVSFPTIRAYKGLKDVVRYRGPRVSRDIIAFSSRIRRRPVTALDSNTLKDFVGTDNIVVVAQLSSQDESLRELFSDAAKEYYDRYTFGVLNTDSANRGLLCYNNVEGTQHVANDLASVRVVHQLVEACIAPTIPELTRRNEMKYLSGGKSLVYYFSNEATDRAAYTAAMRQTAKAYQEYLTLVTVDSNEYPSMPLSMGIESSTGVAVRNLHNGQVFPHRGKSTPEAIGAFIVSISKGEVAPWDGVLPSQKTVPRDEL